jgi:hypothetical protein
MKNGKRILSVTVRRMIDESPDTSWLGEYSNRPKTEYAIDRAHADDCASVRQDIEEAKATLEHVQQTIGDLHNSVLAQYNGTLANEMLDSERDALDAAHDEIGELIEDIDACDCGERGDMGRHEFRYFNGPVENYKGESPEDIRKYVRQDYDRMESLNRGDWCFIGMRAEAEVQTGSDVVQRITSGGLWGIESDSGREHLEETQREELAQLKTELIGLGFSRRAIATAMKNVQEKGD